MLHIPFRAREGNSTFTNKYGLYTQTILLFLFHTNNSRLRYGVREGALRRKYMLTYIFFVRPLLEHGVYEKVPYEKYMLTYIFFVRPLLEHGLYEKVPCAHACARLSRLSFRALLTSR